MTLEFLFYPEVCKALQGWIRTAADPTAASPQKNSRRTESSMRRLFSFC